MSNSALVRKIGFIALGLSGFAALIYEVVWFRAMSQVLGSTTYALSTMLATFMAGLAIGGYVGGLAADRAKRPMLLFIYLEAAIAISALIVYSLIVWLPPVYAWFYYTFQFSFETFSLAQFFLCAIVLIFPTVMMGATFPVMCKICFTGGDIGRETGGLYAINTVGAVFGSLAAGFVLIPQIGLKASNLTAALINLVIALACMILMHRDKLSKMLGLSFVFGAAFIILSLTGNENVYSFNYYAASRFESYEKFAYNYLFAEKLYEEENETGNVKVLQMLSGSRLLVNNGKIESNNESDLLNLAMLAFLPTAINSEARSFLNIGHGTGGTIFYASRNSLLEEIYSIEINPLVLEASEKFFYPDIFQDGRIKYIATDARNYLAVLNTKYDVISSEPSYPVDQGFSNLYSKEFYEIVMSRLNSGGVFCQWVPRYIFRGDEFRMIVKTFNSVFPSVTLWMAKQGDYLLVGGRNLEFQKAAVADRLNVSLKQVGLSDKDVHLVSDASAVAKKLEGYEGPINTDDSPVVEFVGARRMLEIASNLKN